MNTVWLIAKGREVDGVATEVVLFAFSSYQKAHEFRLNQKEEESIYWSIEEVEVDPQ